MNVYVNVKKAYKGDHFNSECSPPLYTYINTPYTQRYTNTHAHTDITSWYLQSGNAGKAVW